MRVLLAVGSQDYAQILRKNLANLDFDVIDSDVYHRRYLEEVIDLEQPDMVIIHDTYLPCEPESVAEKENEMIQMIERWRIKYNDKLRVVYLCEKDRKDPFLGRLIARNVLDIFYKQSIPIHALIEQLSNPPEFRNVARLEVGLYEVGEEEQQDEDHLEVEEIKSTTTEPPPVNVNKAKAEKESVKKDLLEKLKSQLNKKEPLPPGPTRPIIKKEIKIQLGRNKVKSVGYAIPRQLYVVAGGQSRVGSTFISHQMAYAFSNFDIGVTYLENPYQKPYTYERLDGRAKYPEYKSLFQRIAQPEREIPKMFLDEDQISFVALNPLHESTYTEKELEIENVLRLLLNTYENPILIVDIGNDLTSDFSKEMMKVATKVFFVMDHDIPGAIHYNQNELALERLIIEGLKKEGRFQFIVNRSIKSAEAEEMFQEDIYYYPEIPSEVIFKSQLQGSIQFSERSWKKQQVKLILPLIKESVPDVLRKQLK